MDSARRCSFVQSDAAAISRREVDVNTNSGKREVLFLVKRTCILLDHKTFLFSGSDLGGERAAAMCSLIATAKLNGIDPKAYLARALGQHIGPYPPVR